MTTPRGETTSLELGHYLRVVRRRGWVVVLGAFLGLVASFVYLQAVGREVTASTLVNVNVISSDPFSASRSAADMLDSETEVQTVSSSAVLGDVAAALGGDATPSEIRRNLEARLVSDATVMRITYTADSTAAAEAGADAIAESYLTYRSTQANARLQTIVDQLNERRENLRDDLVRINTILRQSRPGSSRAVQAESDRQLVNIELDSLTSQINTFLGLDTTGGVVLTAATESPTLISPSRALILGTGLAVGLLLGAVATFVLHGLDRRVRDGYDIRRAGGGQVLGELHARRAEIPARGEDLDTIRSVRELLFATLPDDPPVVAVADLTSGDRGSDVAVNLAQAAAETGRTVELVMADSEPGLVDRTVAALGLAPLPPEPDVRRFVRGEQLTLIAPRHEGAGFDPTGVKPDDRPGMTVVAVPPGARHSALLEAGRLGHAVLLVVSRGGTPRSEVARAADALALVGARVHGSVTVPRRRKAPKPAPGE